MCVQYVINSRFGNGMCCEDFVGFPELRASHNINIMVFISHFIYFLAYNNNIYNENAFCFSAFTFLLTFFVQMEKFNKLIVMLT